MPSPKSNSSIRKSAAKTSTTKAAKPIKTSAVKTPAKPAKPVRTSAPKAKAAPVESDAAEIDARLRDTKDWRNVTLARMRALIRQAAPDVLERVQWRKPSNSMVGVPTWSHNGLICTGETYKDKVKLTFAQGAALDDPEGLFNANDQGATRRAIDLREGDRVDAAAFQALVRAAVEFNG